LIIPGGNGIVRAMKSLLLSLGMAALVTGCSGVQPKRTSHFSNWPLGASPAEDRPRVGVRLLDGRAGEADERRIRQGIAQVAGEAQMKPPAISVHRESPWRSRQSQPDRVVEHGQV
jgi:hypothetical protein